MRRNIFDIDHVAYLDAWTKLELACGAIDVELDLPLANIDVRPCGLEERPPKNVRRLAPFSHIENQKSQQGLSVLQSSRACLRRFPKDSERNYPLTLGTWRWVPAPVSLASRTRSLA